MARPEESLQPRHQERYVRGWPEVWLLLVGVALFVLASLPIESDSVPGWEQGIFRFFNDYSVVPWVLVWPFMQLGNFFAVPVAAAVAAYTRRFRLAASILLGGAIAYVLAKVVKGEIERGRPAAMLDDVIIRGDVPLGRGYVSGHAAVVTLLAALAWPYLGRRGRAAAAAAVVVVLLARMYVGAHLPLDVIGGAALGLTIAAVIRLLLGRPARADRLDHAVEQQVGR